MIDFKTLLATSKTTGLKKPVFSLQRLPPIDGQSECYATAKDVDKHNNQVHSFVTGDGLMPDKAGPKIEVKKPVIDFTELLVRTNAEKKREETKRDVLFGTGLTKKVAEKEQRAAFKFNFGTKELSREEKVILNEKNRVVEQPPIISKPIPSDIKWDEYQLAALKGIRKQKYACLIGAAGTGKTTVTKQLVSEIEETVSLIDLNRAKVKQSDKKEMNVAIAFCAFTGRAVQQMKLVLPKEYHPMCNTVHATLGYAPERIAYYDEEKKIWKEKLHFRPTFTAANKLPFECVVIDEGGTVPINLWNELYAALPDKCRIIIIGDINQLPPVQGRSVLGFAMLNWPTYTLEKIHRQAADNPIIANAHRILQGQFPEKDAKKFAMMRVDDGSIKAFNQTVGVIQQLHKRGLFDPFRDALIVPQNKETIGQVALNERLVHYFNPAKLEDGTPGNKRYIITAGYIHVIYAVGDKVMLLQNDRERGLTNGMIGRVVDIAVNGMFAGKRASHAVTDKFTGSLDVDDIATLETNEDLNQKEDDEKQQQASHILTVRFEGADEGLEVPFSTSGQYTKLTLAYASTCHKLQGGERPVIVILVHSANIRMLTREWLYTAVTRAQDKVILLYNDRGLAQAVYTQRIKGKTIKEKALQFLALQDKDDTKLPDLPKPVEI